MGSRINLKGLNNLIQNKILKEPASWNRGEKLKSTPLSKEIEATLKEYVDNHAPKDKKQVFEYLLQRFQAEGDSFTKLTNFGPYNEIIAGILLGVYKTKEDIVNYKVLDSIPGLDEGDLVYADNNQLIHGQVKGAKSEFHIPLGTFLSLDRTKNETSVNKVGSNMETSIKVQMLRSAAENLENSIPDSGNFRVIVPIYRNKGAVGVFDMGLLTFKKLMVLRPEMFYFELKPEGKSLSIFKPVQEWVSFARGQIAVPTRRTKTGKASEADQQMTQLVLDDILNIDSSQADDALEEALYLILYKARVAAWYKYGRIRFSFENPSLLVEAVEPLINTGLRKGDDLKPFLVLLRNLYKRGYNRALEEYLSDAPTGPNKLPEYYYNDTYADPNY